MSGNHTINTHNTMINEQINERIALLCGWKRSPLSGAWCHPDNWSIALNGAYSVWVGRDKLPNYAADLNACYEFEMGLDYEQAELYDDELCDVCAKTNKLLDNPKPWRFAVTTANARQRCEAFLRVHNQWEDEA